MLLYIAFTGFYKLIVKFRPKLLCARTENTQEVHVESAPMGHGGCRRQAYRARQWSGKPLTMLHTPLKF